MFTELTVSTFGITGLFGLEGIKVGYIQCNVFTTFISRNIKLKKKKGQELEKNISLRVCISFCFCLKSFFFKLHIISPYETLLEPNCLPSLPEVTTTMNSAFILSSMSAVFHMFVRYL